MEEALSIFAVIGIFVSVISRLINSSAKRPAHRATPFPAPQAGEDAAGAQAQSEGVRSKAGAGRPDRSIALSNPKSISANTPVARPKVDAKALRKAVIMSEILNKPVSIREK